MVVTLAKSIIVITITAVDVAADRTGVPLLIANVITASACVTYSPTATAGGGAGETSDARTPIRTR